MSEDVGSVGWSPDYDAKEAYDRAEIAYRIQINRIEADRKVLEEANMGYAVQNRDLRRERDRLVQQNSEAVLLVARLRADLEEAQNHYPSALRAAEAERDRLRAENAMLKSDLAEAREYGDRWRAIANGYVKDEHPPPSRHRGIGQ